MYLCSSYCLLCMFSVSDSSIYMIYYRSFNFPYITCHFLYLHTWTTSLDHVHVCPLCTPFGFIICTRRVTSDNPKFSCSDPRDRTLVAYCSWSEYAADPSVTIGVQQMLGSSSQLFLPVPLLFGSRDLSCCSWAPLNFCISLHMMYFCIFWWCNILLILYHSLW